MIIQGNSNSADQEVELNSSVFDRILVMLINEAVDALYLGIASEFDIEIAMKKGVNYPKGLIEWGKEKNTVGASNNWTSYIIVTTRIDTDVPHY